MAVLRAMPDTSAVPEGRISASVIRRQIANELLSRVAPDYASARRATADKSLIRLTSCEFWRSINR